MIFTAYSIDSIGIRGCQKVARRGEIAPQHGCESSSSNAMPRDKNVPQIDLQDKRLLQLAKQLDVLVAERAGADTTFEERQRIRSEVMAEVMWKAEDDDLRSMRTEAEQVEVGGKIYRRLNQPSSASYHGLWGTHIIEEPLYRDSSVRAGPTIKPLELRAGIVHGMLPDLARVLGRQLAHLTSREVETGLRDLGFRPPGRAFIEKRGGEMACELNDNIAALEAGAPPALPEGVEVAAVSCGLDRMAVRMHEPLSGEPDAPRVRQKPRSRPYKRTPPPPAELNWRMAWVGTVTLYDADGEALRTLRYSANADADRVAFADRVAADVHALIERNPGIPVVCIQDAAKDLQVLVDRLRIAIPANSSLYHRVDFHHLLTYLDAVVQTCEPPGDPHRMKLWYRDELLRDDNAIDRIFNNLRRTAKKLPMTNPEGRAALARALRYIKDRRPLMRYAHLASSNLPVGSGATESTCALMQLRLKQPGMSWETDGLRGISTLRTLVLSERWPTAWEVYATKHRLEVRAA